MTSSSPAPADPDAYRIAVGGPEIETRVQGSRFLGRLLAAPGENAARDHLQTIRKHHHDATHHCWGWRIGDPWHLDERSDDDGEPPGTGGRPVLGALLRADLYDALIVVTRYFGGTKLGTGGLTRAYGEAAALAVAAAASRPAWRSRSWVVSCAFDDVGAVETILGRHAAWVLEIRRSFEPSPVFRVRVRHSRAAPLEAALVAATAGRVRVENPA